MNFFYTVEWCCDIGVEHCVLLLYVVQSSFDIELLCGWYRIQHLHDFTHIFVPSAN